MSFPNERALEYREFFPAWFEVLAILDPHASDSVEYISGLIYSDEGMAFMETARALVERQVRIPKDLLDRFVEENEDSDQPMEETDALIEKLRRRSMV